MICQLMKHPDPLFQAKLATLQSRSPPDNVNFSRTSQTKRRRTKIPELHTFGATSKSTTIEELTSLTDFVDRLEKVQFPSQMVAILHDRRLQYLFLFKATDIERRRLDHWLAAALVEGAEDGLLPELLRSCVEFVEFTKECPACLEGFLRMYLKSWDGQVNRDSVLDLVVYLIPTDFDGTPLSRC